MTIMILLQILVVKFGGYPVRAGVGLSIVIKRMFTFCVNIGMLIFMVSNCAAQKNLMLI